MKKIPMRKCVVTDERLPKKELVRVVRTTSGTVEVDVTGRLNGRGAYIKLSEEAIQLAKKSKALDKALECTVEESVYDTLRNMLTNK
ncbi:MAG: YlxR family protein [Erysipelotrichaceae bacterium]|nr:YlxR family protein [Erysipelotrichaceae bacterium]